MNKRKRIILLIVVSLIFLSLLFYSATMFKGNDVFSYIANFYGGNKAIMTYPSVTIVKYGADW